jgi:hypothetical protein
MVESSEGSIEAILALAAYGGLPKGEILELRRKDLEIIEEQGERWVRVSLSRYQRSTGRDAELLRKLA